MALRYLLGFTAWTAAHIGVISAFRVRATMNGAKVNQFPADKDPSTHAISSPIYPRVIRAHANCLENLPLFAAVVLVNHVARGPNIDQLAQIYFWSRVAQSLTHWLSASEVAINVRFVFFIAQQVCLGMMGWKTFESLKN